MAPKPLDILKKGLENFSKKESRVRKNINLEVITEGKSCGCWRSSPVDVNFVLVGSLRGAPKKSTVGRLLRGAKDDGGGG